MLFVIFVGIACLAASAYLFGDAVTLPARERRVSVKRAARYGARQQVHGFAQQPFRDRVLSPLGDRLARWTLKLHPKTTIEGVSARLQAAGVGRSITPTSFLAFKSGLAILGVFFGAVFGGAVTGAGGVPLFSPALGGMGFIGPDFVFSGKARTRRERIRAELPDALDPMWRGGAGGRGGGGGAPA